VSECRRCSRVEDIAALVIFEDDLDYMRNPWDISCRSRAPRPRDDGRRDHYNGCESDTHHDT
jgi:hypothetical protein